jgi:hypothetical protein
MNIVQKLQDEKRQQTRERRRGICLEREKRLKTAENGKPEDQRKSPASCYRIAASAKAERNTIARNLGRSGEQATGMAPERNEDKPQFKKIVKKIAVIVSF